MYRRIFHRWLARLRAQIRKAPIAMVSTTLMACGSQSTEHVHPGSHEPVILPEAIIPMTPAQFPRFYAGFGPAAFNRANARTEEAARAIASDPRCDALEMIGVADRSTAGQIHWVGDCTNGYRGRVSEDELGR